MQAFVYPVRLTADKAAGGFVVTCRDIPEAITQGESKDEALDEAAGALQAAIEMRIEDGLDIPSATPKKRGEYLVSVPTSTTAKLSSF